MGTPRLSASRLRLATICTHWLTLDAPSEKPSRYAAKGTALHALVEGAPDSAEKIAALSREDADDVANWFAEWAKSPWAKVPWRNEVPMAWHPSDSARELPRGEHREYVGAAPSELVGTVDLLHVAGNRAWLADLKTGFARDMEPVAEHSQLRALAVFASRAFMLDSVTIQLIHLGDGGLTATEYEMGAAELDAEASRLTSLFTATPTGPRPGGHCARLYCPASNVCPATQALVKAAAPEVAFTLREPGTDAECLALRDGAERLQAIAEAASRLAKEYADKRGGVAIDDRKVWKATTREQFVLSRPGFAEFTSKLAELGIANAVEVETKQNCSQASIGRAIQAAHPEWSAAVVRSHVAQVMEIARRCEVIGEVPAGHREVRGRPSAAGSTT